MARTDSTTLTRLASIEATRVRLPLVRPQALGRPVRERVRRVEPIIVRVTDDTGLSGWGEITAPIGPSEYGSRWEALVERFAPALLRHSWHRPTEVLDAWGDLPAHPRVQAGLDMACWDLWSRRRDTPLSHALGGTRTTVTAGVTLSRQPTLDSLIHETNRQVGNGFLRVRLEIEPGWDLEVVRAVQRTFPFLVLQVDAHGRYTESAEHLAALRALDGYGLLAIEQPFPGDDLAAHARLRREIQTPIALGAGIDSPARLDEAVRLDAASALNLRVAHMGGLTPARRAHDRAVDAGWRVWCGSDGESGLGRTGLVALASLSGVTLPSEFPPSGGRHTRDIISPPVRAHDGVVPVPLTRPGLGHTVDETALHDTAVESITLTGD